MNYSVITAMLLATSAACSSAPLTAEVRRPAPAPVAASDPEPSCREGRITACDCAAGKGYRPCTAGRLGDCICERPDDRALHRRPAAARTDPTAPPEDVAAPPTRARRTASGLAYRTLRSGAGTAHPAPTSRITVHYSGWTTDGKLFDSSHTRDRPATFPLQHLIPGWVEGLQLMVVGDWVRLWIPESLAYQGKPGRPQGMLVFDVELLAID